jgi:hypothetical protein
VAACSSEGLRVIAEPRPCFSILGLATDRWMGRKMSPSHTSSLVHGLVKNSAESALASGLEVTFSTYLSLRRGNTRTAAIAVWGQAVTPLICRACALLVRRTFVRLTKLTILLHTHLSSMCWRLHCRYGNVFLLIWTLPASHRWKSNAYLQGSKHVAAPDNSKTRVISAIRWCCWFLYSLN